MKFVIGGSFLWLIITYSAGFLWKDEAFGYTFCRVSQWVVALGQCSTCTGGLGIALVRLIYVKHKHWMVLLGGEWQTAALVSCSMQLFALTITYQWCTANLPYKTIVLFCLNIPEEQGIIMFDYSQLKDSTFQAQMVPVVGLLLLATECLIYLDIFTYLHKHNKGMTGILSEQKSRQRRNKNVIQISGHILALAFRCATALVFVLSTVYLRKSTVRVAAFFTSMVTYSLVRGIQIILSTRLRQDAIRALQYVAGLNLRPLWPFKRATSSDNHVWPVVVIGLEQPPLHRHDFRRARSDDEDTEEYINPNIATSLDFPVPRPVTSLMLVEAMVGGPVSISRQTIQH